MEGWADLVSMSDPGKDSGLGSMWGSSGWGLAEEITWQDWGDPRAALPQSQRDEVMGPMYIGVNPGGRSGTVCVGHSTCTSASP